MFLPHFDVICALLLDRRTATWNLLANIRTVVCTEHETCYYEPLQKVSRVQVSVGNVLAVNVLTVIVVEQAKEELSNLTNSFDDNLAVLQTSESNESQRNRDQRIVS